MNKTLKRIVGVLLTVCLLIGCLTGLSKLTQRKNAYVNYVPFYDCADTTDVLFFGTSHMFDAVSPMDMWSEYGITAYNCAASGVPVPVDYWIMINALDYAKPQLLVLDCYRMNSEERCIDHSSLANIFDSMPLSINKIRAVFDLQQDDKDTELIKSILCPFYIYHNRWSELEGQDFEPQYSVQKGARQRINVASPNELVHTDEVQDLSYESVGIEYLRKFIEECEKRNIQLLLTYLPFPATEQECIEANTVQLIADEYGVDYINFLNVDVVDYSTDLFDSYSHLNPSGAKKISSYLGEYITENYGISDRRGQAGYEQWDEDWLEYEQYKFSVLENEVYLSNILMLLYDKDFSALLVLEEGSAVYGNDTLMALVKNMAGGQELPELEKARESGQRYTLLVDNSSGTVQEMVEPDGSYSGAEAYLEIVSVSKPELSLSYSFVPGDDGVLGKKY